MLRLRSLPSALALWGDGLDAKYLRPDAARRGEDGSLGLVQDGVVSGDEDRHDRLASMSHVGIRSVRTRSGAEPHTPPNRAR